jgi:hypothetical protein
MSRGVTCLVLLVTAGVLALAAAPKPNQAPGKEAAPAMPLADKLYKVITYDGMDDPKATLQDLLDMLSKVHEITFDLNEVAFKEELVNDVAKQEVGHTPIPRMERVRLRVVLNRILQRVAVPSGATWLVRGDHIEITTRAAARREVFGAKGADQPLPVLVNAEFQRVPLEQALETITERSDRNVVLDNAVDEKNAAAPITLRLRNTPVDTAALLVASRAGLQVVEMDNVLFVTTAEKAANIAREHAKFRPAPPRKATKTP